MQPDQAGVQISDDELAVLDGLYEVEWDQESLAALRTMESDAAQLVRLRTAVTGLFRKQLVEIRETRDFTKERPRLLDSSEAESVLQEDRCWAVPGEPLFDPKADYYLVVPTQAAQDLFEAAVDGGRWVHDCARYGLR